MPFVPVLLLGPKDAQPTVCTIENVINIPAQRYPLWPSLPSRIAESQKLSRIRVPDTLNSGESCFEANHFGFGNQRTASMMTKPSVSRFEMVTLPVFPNRNVPTEVNRPPTFGASR